MSSKSTAKSTIKPAANKSGPPKKAGAAKPTAKGTAKKPVSQEPAKAPGEEVKGGTQGTTATGPTSSTIQVVLLKRIADVVLKDEDGILKESNKWPLLLDDTNAAGRFLQYNSNYVTAIEITTTTSEKARLALMGALRYGKPLVVDMLEADLYDAIKEKFDEIKPGLMAAVLDKSIMKEEVYKDILKPGIDEDRYNVKEFSPEMVEAFQFILVTTKTEPIHPDLRKTMQPIRIVPKLEN